nr:hypothetical protein [Hypnocyclicus thermotrophus]
MPRIIRTKAPKNSAFVVKNLFALFPIYTPLKQIIKVINPMIATENIIFKCFVKAKENPAASASMLVAIARRIRL